MRSDSESARVSEDIITDLLTYDRTTVTYGGDSPLLTSAGARRTKQTLDWTETSGKLACLSSVDHSFSHSFLKNTALSEDIVIFTVKAGLQVPLTRLNLSIWFPTTQIPRCLHYTTEQITETYIEWLPCLQGNVHSMPRQNSGPDSERYIK